MLITDEKRKEAVVRAMADHLSRMIIEETIQEAKSAPEIVESKALPRASVYRRINELIEEGILMVERSILTNEGRKYDLFRSRFTDISVELKDGLLEVHASFNRPPEERVRRYFSLDRR